MYTNKQLNNVMRKLKPEYVISDRMPKYINTKNEATNIPTEKCQICIQNKNKIMFGCMKHMSCLTCCLNSENCPFCRNNKERIKIFD